jgi:hypothetical protein
VLLRELSEVLERSGFGSLSQARRSLNLVNCPEPKVYERVSYLRVLSSFRSPPADRR